MEKDPFDQTAKEKPNVANVGTTKKQPSSAMTEVAEDKQPKAVGTQLTDMMRAPKKNEFLMADSQNKKAILDAYGGIESNVPMTHPTYWNL